MRRDRKVNIIRSLKHELSFYKRQSMAGLNHLKLHAMFSKKEVIQMPKEEVSPLLQHKMAKAFEDAIMQFPIETEYDEHFGVYRANIDL